MCLVVHEKITVEVRGSDGSLVEILCSAGSTIYLAGGSEMHTLGEGRITCIFLAFEKRQQ